MIVGDARGRGTFEERKADAISKQIIEAEHKTALVTKIEASRTPEQKLKEHHAMMKLMIMLGMAGAYGLPTVNRIKNGS